MSDSVTPWTIAHQAPSMEFSSQVYWSGLPFPSPGDFPTQGSNPGLLHCRQMLYRLSHQGIPTFLRSHSCFYLYFLLVTGDNPKWDSALVRGYTIVYILTLWAFALYWVSWRSCQIMSDSLWPHRLQHQASMPFTISRSLLRLMSIESVMLSNLLILCHPLDFNLSLGCHFSLVPLRSDQISRSVVSNSLWPHESQHTRPPCPSPTPGVHWDSRPLSQWCHPAISSSVVPLSSCPQSLPASESFPMSQLFAGGGQSTGVSACSSSLCLFTGSSVLSGFLYTLKGEEIQNTGGKFICSPVILPVVAFKITCFLFAGMCFAVWINVC